MPEINIKVRDKCAEGDGVIICNNSDYTVVWDLDSEWEPYSTRTMRVNLADGTYQDVVFSGDTAALPVLTASGWVSVGLYAGDIHTTRAARLLALSSVLSPGGSPAAPAEDVYSQLMERMAQLETPDWNQNDETAKDYIKNRTHFAETIRETIYSNDSLDVASASFQIDIPELPTAPGIAFEIAWDDKIYSYELSSTNYYGRDWYWMGNGSLAAPYSSFGAETDDPFLITNNRLLSDQIGKHSIAITSRRIAYHKLAPEFLADVESALTENSQEILNVSASDYVLKGSGLYPKENGWVSYLSTQRFDSLRALDVTKNVVFFLDSGIDKTYIDVTKYYDFVVTEGSYKYNVSAIKMDGSQVIKADMPTGCAVLVWLKTSRKLVLLNPKINEIVIPSSTSGSSKKFKIAVDDSGTISATEVT